MTGLHLNEPVLYALLGLYVILALSWAIHYLLRNKFSDALNLELRQRIKAWWVMTVIFTIAITLSQTVSIIFFAFISFLALKEYFSIIPTRRVDRRVLFWAYLAIVVQYYWVGTQWYGMFIIFIPVYMFLILPLLMIIKGETQNFLRAVGTLHWGLMMFVFSLSHLAFLLNIPNPETTSVQGAGLVLYLIFLTQFNDVAQYISGKCLGKRSIVPTISPNKTTAGLFGGILTTVLLAVLLAPVLTPIKPLFAVFAGLIISLGGFIGDVTISAVKRDIGIKDSSQLIPGHGGILDRVDSLTYTAPLFFHFMYYFYS